MLGNINGSSKPSFGSFIFKNVARRMSFLDAPLKLFVFSCMMCSWFKHILFPSQLDMNGTNSVLYFGLFEGRNPDPKTNPGYIIMYSFLVFYKWIQQKGFLILTCIFLTALLLVQNHSFCIWMILCAFLVFPHVAHFWKVFLFINAIWHYSNEFLKQLTNETVTKSHRNWQIFFK